MGPDIALLLVAILVIVLIWRGPAMLPKIGEALGKTVKNAKEDLPSAIKGDDAETGSAGDSRDT